MKEIHFYENYIEDGYKQLITLSCPPKMAKEELRKWWLEEHAQRVKKLPGLKLYTVVFTEEKTFGPPKPFDGFEEMWFETLDDLKKAYESDLWQQEIEHMEDKYLYRPLYFQGGWLEGFNVKMTGQKTEVPTKKGLIRLLGSVKRLPGMTKKEIKDWYYMHAMRALDENGAMTTIPGIIGYTHSFAIRSPYGPNFGDACCGNWWYNLEEIERDFSAPKMSSQSEHSKELWDFNDLNQTQITWGEQFVIDL